MKTFVKVLSISLVLFLMTLEARNDVMGVAGSLQILKNSLVTLSDRLKNVARKPEPSKKPLATIPTKPPKGWEDLPFAEVYEPREFFKFAGGRNYDAALINKLAYQLQTGVDETVLAADNLEMFLAADERVLESESFEAFITGQAVLAPNDIREKLTKKWIRNAAIRVFSDYLRAFLEIVVNACDAMLEAKARELDGEGETKRATAERNKVAGKFGMGFFSILSFLRHLETDGTVINIMSAYNPTFNVATKHTDNPKALYAYSMKFEGGSDPRDLESDTKVTFRRITKGASIKSLFDATTGTIVQITPKNHLKKFSDATINALRTYVHFLDLYQHVRVHLTIEYNDGTKITEIIGGDDKTPIVSVLLSPTKLLAKDAGNGLPYKVALTSLLIPSSSTKRRSDLDEARTAARAKPGEKPRLVQREAKKDKNKSHFLITVNGVVVVDKVLQQDLKNKAGELCDLAIPMPQATQLTIARDELSITPDGKSFEEESLTKIIKETLNSFVVGEEELDDALLLALYRGLEEWENQSAATHIRGVFTGEFKKELSRLLSSNASLIPVPRAFAEKIKDDDLSGSFSLLTLDDELANYNFSKLEQQFRDIARRNIDKIRIPHTPKAELELIKDIMRKGLDGKLIAGSIVFFIDQKEAAANLDVDNLGLRSCIFVPVTIFAKIKEDKKPITEQTVAEAIAAQVPLQSLRQPEKEDKQEMIILGTGSSDASITEDIIFLPPDYDPAKLPLFTNADNKWLASFFEKYKDLFAYQALVNIFGVSSSASMPSKSCLLSLYKNNPDLFVWDVNEAMWGGKKHDCWTMKYGDFFVVDFDLFITLLNDVQQTCSQDVSKDFARNMLSYSLQLFPFSGLRKLFQLGKNALANKGIINNGQFDAEYKNFFLCDASQHTFYCLHFPPNHGFTNYPDGKNFLKDLSQVKLLDAKQLAALLKKYPSIFIKTEPYEFFNHFLRTLLRWYGIKLEAESASRQVILEGTTKIWPLQEKNAEKLEALLVPLVSYLDVLHANRKYVPRRIHKPFSLKDYPAEHENLPERMKRVLADTSAQVVYVGIPGATEALLRKALTHAASDIAWAGSLNRVLVRSIDGISFFDVLASILPWYLSAIESRLPDETKKQVLQMKESLYGLYNSYFNIPFEFFPTVYGSSERTEAKIPESDVQANALFDLIVMFSGDLDLFKKLVSFQIIDLKQKTSREWQKQDLARNVLYVPYVHAFTPLSILSCLHEKWLPAELIKIIVQKSKSPEELLFIGHLLLQSDIIALIQKHKDKVNALASVLELIIVHYIQEKIDKERINELYQICRELLMFQERLDLYGKEPAHAILFDYLKNEVQETSAFNARTSFLDQAFENIITANKAKAFTLKQLIQAHCHGGGLLTMLQESEQQSSLDDLVQHIKKRTGTFDLGKVTQSVEAGSERSPIEGSLIECEQNSIDAANSFVKDLKGASHASYQARLKAHGSDDKVHTELATIRYSLESLDAKDPSKAHVCLTVRDYVGFPSLKTLLADLLIPDYSSKSQYTGNIGDMGNGSFKMYQDTEQASFLTRTVQNPEKFYLLHITPMRDKAQLVDDLNIISVDISDHMQKKFPNFFGTSIKLLFKPVPKNQVAMQLVAIKDFLFNCLGSTQFKLDGKTPVKLVLEEMQGGKTTERLLNPELKDIVYEHKPAGEQKPWFVIRKRHQELLQSFATTSGIPFRQFGALTKQMNLLPLNFNHQIGFGYIVDFSLGTYAPVQSRTQLQMEAAKLLELRKALFEAFYIIGLQKGVKDVGFFENYVTHFKSSVGSLEQVRLSTSDNENFQKMMEAWIAGTVKERYLNQNHFFDFYRPLFAQPDALQSVYDYLENGFNNVVSSLAAKKKILEQQLEQEFSQIATNHGKELKHIEAISEDEAKKKAFEEFVAKYITPSTTNKQQLFNEHKKSVFAAWKNKFLHLSDNKAIVVHRIAIPWFEKKIDAMGLENMQGKLLQSLKKDFAGLQTKEEKYIQDRFRNALQYIGDVLPAIKNLCNAVLQGFCESFMQVIGKGPIKAEFYYGKSDQRAGYCQENLLRINMAYCNFADQLNLMRLLFPENKTPQSPLAAQGYISLYAPTHSYATTVLHELEHARRGESGEGFHSQGDDATGKKSVPFDACANSWGAFALQKGLVQLWEKSVVEHAKRNKSDVSSIHNRWDYKSHELRGLEALDRGLLLEKIFGG